MAALTIRKLEPRIKERLRPRVARHGRSMEEEARAILAYATIAAVRARRGRPISVFDAQMLRLLARTVLSSPRGTSPTSTVAGFA